MKTKTIIIAVLILAAIAAAYYFLVYKKSPAVKAAAAVKNPATLLDMGASQASAERNVHVVNGVPVLDGQTQYGCSGGVRYVRNGGTWTSMSGSCKVGDAVI